MFQVDMMRELSRKGRVRAPLEPVSLTCAAAHGEQPRWLPYKRFDKITGMVNVPTVFRVNLAHSTEPHLRRNQPVFKALDPKPRAALGELCR